MKKSSCTIPDEGIEAVNKLYREYVAIAEELNAAYRKWDAMRDTDADIVSIQGRLKDTNSAFENSYDRNLRFVPRRRRLKILL